jgi:hypothetical protein
VIPQDLELEDQQRILSKLLSNLAGLGADACSVALQAGRSAERALTQLESSRGIILGYTLDSKYGSLRRLKDYYPELSNRVEACKKYLFSSPNAITEGDLLQLSSDVQQQVEAQREFKTILAKIRTMSGFERFLIPPTPHERSELAREGPIIYLNCTRIRSDAFIVRRDGIQSKSLTAMNYYEFLAAMRDLVENTSSPDLERYWERNQKIARVLKYLWVSVVAPICELLGLAPRKSSEELPRIWWIPSGITGIAPFHAAGDHTPRSQNHLFCRAISSYVPTMKILMYSRVWSYRHWPEEEIYGLAVSMPETPGHATLTSALKEADVLLKLLPQRTTLLQSPSANEVLEQLSRHSIIHLACHGQSKLMDPGASHLLLLKKRYDGNKEGHHTEEVDHLTVRNIIAMDIFRSDHDRPGRGPGLAFLSACSTAQIGIDSNLIDESLHLASAFQASGFSDVVATLWVGEDRACLSVAQAFYEALIRSSSVDIRRSAHCLHEAISKVKTGAGDVGGWDLPLEWAGFAHFGA